MKKVWPFLGLIFIVLFCSAFSLKEWQVSVYEQIKSETIKGLEQNFQAHVEIGQTQGPIVGQIVFEDVVIKNFAQAKKVYVNYNPIVFATKKDVVPAITKITVEDGTFTVTRNKDNQLNVLGLLLPEDPNAPPPPPFHGEIFLKNCRLVYTDELGSGSEPKVFSENLLELEGKASFKKKNQISYELRGNLYQKLKAEPIQVKGLTDFKQNTFQIDIQADKLDLKKWGTYTLPFDQLTLESGKVDLAIRIANPKTAGWPVSLTGEFVFHEGSGKFNPYQFSQTSGKLTMADDYLILKNISGTVNGLPLTLNGRFVDFAKQKLDFTISLTDLDLKKAARLLPETKEIDIQGSAFGDLKVAGTIAQPQLTGLIKVESAALYQQQLQGPVEISYQAGILKTKFSKLKIYGGLLSGLSEIDFSAPAPIVTVRTSLSAIDLAVLSKNSPGIVGQANGTLSLFGPLNDIKGELKTTLTSAMLLGQPIEILSGTFNIKENGVEFTDFSANSSQAQIKASGKISTDLNFTFSASAEGIKLSGQGLLGTMEALVDHFQGDVSWQLNQNFFSAPLKHITAAGQVKLSQGRIGDQLFDSAQGKLKMGQGLVNIEDVVFRQGTSILAVSGQTGLGQETQLTIKGQKLKLADLKILNYVLPPEAQDPSGLMDLEATIFGQLPSDTIITDLDQLLKLNAKGSLALHQANVADIPITEGGLGFTWQNQHITSAQGKVILPDSDLTFAFQPKENGTYKGTLTGIINLDRLQKFTRRYGRLSGRLGINLASTGTTQRPQWASSFWLEDLHFNALTFDRVKGKLFFAEDKLYLSEPIRFAKGRDRFELTGVANLAGWRQGQPEETHLNLNLKIIESGLASANTLFEQVRTEISSRLAPVGQQGKSTLTLGQITLPKTRDFLRQNKLVLYSEKQALPTFLNAWQKLFQELNKPEQAASAAKLGGKLFGQVALWGKTKNLASKFSFEVRHGYFNRFTFDNLKVEASLKDEAIIVSKAELRKDQGRLKANGQIGLNGNLGLTLTGQLMPLDSLKLVFDEEFRGTFNFNASVNGSLENPRIIAAAITNSIQIAGLDFDQAKLSFNKNNAQLTIHECTLKEDDNESQIKGSIDFIAPGRLDLSATLKDNALGLVNLLTPEIKWLKGKSYVSLTAQGSLAEPKVNGKAFLKDGSIYVKFLDSQISQVSGEAIIKDNLISLAGISGYWQGENTKGYQNFLGAAGSIDLSKSFGDQPSIDLDLVFTPSIMVARLPNLFTGTVTIKDASLIGPLYFDLSAGPTLIGTADIDNAVIFMSRQKKQQKAFPLNLSLETKLNKNIYAVMGDVWTTDLSNVFMNLEIKSDDLKISGSLASPSLLGVIDLKRGTVNIFNREFSLLSETLQKDYFPFSPDQVKPNKASFTGQEGEAGIMPNVEITAKTEVETTTRNSDGTTTAKNVIILSKLTGVLGDQDKEEGLRATFASFTEDKTAGARQINAASYDEQEIKVLLLPEFIKSLTGVSQDNASAPEANTVVADYISSNIQTVLFRSLERSLEQRLGLESLTLEYNFGKDVRSAMGVQETRAFEEKPDWRVGFVKGFFDKFFVDVRYSQYAEASASAAETSLNYQLTYKLSPVWSIIYYREPPSLEELYAGNQKVTLQAGLSFW
ncbi:MAG: translocation/assembly module TamB domain-containing protein [bacterium]